MIFIQYDPVTGQIIGRGDVPDSMADLQEGPLLWLDGDPRTQYVDVGLKLLRTKPPSPSPDHVWDWATKSWQVDLASVEQRVRQRRAALLQASDWTQLSDVTISPQWVVYRQALRDIPEQPGFPLTVTWPEQP